MSNSVRIDWQGAQYLGDVTRATEDALKAGAKVIAARAAELVPVGSPHRKSPRRYPSGYVYAAGKEPILSKSFKVRAGLGRTGAYATVRSAVGYSLFVAGGIRGKAPRAGRNLYMSKAKDESRDAVIAAIKAAMP
jgi:hypothetical protein